MTSDGRPLVTRRRKTAADWDAEMARAVASRGSWRGGRVAFAGGGGGSSEEEGGSDDWEDGGGESWHPVCGRGGAADSDEDEDVELEEAEPAEERGQPDGACVVEADEGDAWLFLLLRQLSSCPGPLGARERP
jgi:hypothetical protein